MGMHPKSQILTILAATFFSVACSTTVESITSTPSSEDDRAPQGSAAESDSDELAFKAGPSALGHGRVAGAASYLRTTDAGAGGGTDAGTTATTVSTDKTSYTYGEVIKVTFANMPGNSDDWISFAPVGENNLYYSWWRYTKSSTGTTMETNELDKLPPGTYEARAYFANGYDIQATSAQFTVTGTMTTNPDASVSISGGQTTCSASPRSATAARYPTYRRCAWR